MKVLTPLSIIYPKKFLLETIHQEQRNIYAKYVHYIFFLEIVKKDLSVLKVVEWFVCCM